MTRLRSVVQAAVIIVGLSLVTASAAAQSFELIVRDDKLFGADEGTLVFTGDGVTYQTTDREDTRQWTYDDLKQIQIVSPTHVVMVTYQDQGWVKLGADRVFDLEVTGAPVSEDLVNFLLDRVQRPLVIGVVPMLDATPLFRVPVKLRQRMRGSHGMLELVDDYLVYRTEREEHARLWRIADLHLVFRPDRHRLTVEAYEGGGDRTRAFEFEVKQLLPPGALEAIWERMYGPSHGREWAVPD